MILRDFLGLILLVLCFILKYQELATLEGKKLFLLHML